MAATFAFLSVASLETAQAGSAPASDLRPESYPQSSPYAAEVTGITFSSTPVYEGESTVIVTVKNLSSTSGPYGGEATFRLLLEIDPPGFNNTETHDLGTLAFDRPNTTGAIKTFEKKYTFERTSLLSRYRFNAKVYDPGQSHVFAEGSEELSVSEITYDAGVRNIRISPSTVYPEDSATISATFTNQVQSNSGEGTFDIVFVIEDPDGGTEYIILEDEQFTRRQSRSLSGSHEFSQSGRHTIKAQIYNPDRSHLFDETSRSFTVRSVSYDAEVRSIRVSPSTVYPGDSATISATFTNQVQSSSGEGTFDIVFVIENPDGGTNYIILEDRGFTRSQSKSLSGSHEFSQAGRHTIRAQIYNPDRSHRFDETSRSFTVAAPPSPVFEAEVTRVYPVRGMHIGQNAIVNVDWFVDLDNPQNVTGPTLVLSASFYPQQGTGVSLPGTTGTLTVPVGASKSTLLNVPQPPNPGDYRICASIGPAAISNGDFDADSSNDSACTEVRILPDLGDDFSEGLVAFPLSDDRNERFWVYVPDAYTEPVKVADAVDERTWGGFEHWNDRKNHYRNLALDIARRGQYISGRIILIDIPDDKKTEILNELSRSAEKLAEEFEPIDLAAEPAIENAELLVNSLLAANHIDPDYANSVISHLGHASTALNRANYVATYGPILLDIVASESVNRAIVVVDAQKILAALEALPMGDAWEEAITEARADIAAMTHPDAMVRWAKSIEDHLDELVVATARLAATYAAKAAVAKVLGTVGVAGGPVTVVVAAAAAVIAAGYFAIDETGEFWDGMSLAATAAQVYSHLFISDPENYKGDPDLRAKEEGKRLALDYTRFAFYQYLHDAADTSDLVPILGIDESLVRSKEKEISHERDLALAEQLELGWKPDDDFKYLDTKRPLDIWSDGQTLWAIDGQSLNDHLIHGYHMRNKNLLPDRELKFDTTFLQLGVIPDVILSSANRSIWQDTITGTMWVMDNAGHAEIFAYDTVQKRRDEEREFDIKDFYPFDVSPLKPIADAVYGTAALATEDPFKPLPQTLAESFAGQLLKPLGIDLEELLTWPDLIPNGIWSDGETMWFATREQIYAFNLDDGSRVPDKDFLLDPDNADSMGLWSHGGTMWVSDGVDGAIYAYKMSDMSRDPANDLYTVKVPNIADNSHPTGIWSDGETMWVADRETDRIFAYTLPDSLSPPLSLTASAVGDSRVDLTWDTPLDSGRAPITGYQVEESQDGISWTTVSANTGSTGTSYSRTGLSDWGVRYYRVAAINRVGTGPLSATAVAYEGFSIDKITCTPGRFYIGEQVDCSVTIDGRSEPEYDYAWHAPDGVATWAPRNARSVSVTWNAPGAQPLQVIACRTGNPSEYINTTLADVGPANIDVAQASAGACAERTQTFQVADLAPSIYFQNPGDSSIPEFIGVGDSFDLEFEIGRKTWVGSPGGITVSFPDLTLDNQVSRATSYNSDQARVLTVTSATTFAEVAFIDNGSSTTLENSSGNRLTSQHLAVAADTDDWPDGPSVPTRTLRLRIWPKEAGDFRVQYRYWLCNEDRTDDDGDPYCARYPKQDDADNPARDQQGWATYEFTVTVIPKPEIVALGCDAVTVDVDAALTCTPTYDGGDIDSYAWRAGYGVVGGDPSSGSDPAFTTKWGFSGQQKVELEVCNDVSGCVSDDATVTVRSDPTETEEEEMMPEETEEEEPDDGGRVLVSGLASDWAHSSYSPTDTTIQVRALPTPDMPTLEVTILDEDGFAPASGDYVTPGALVMALPDVVWVDHAGIAVEMQIAGEWVDYTDELEEALLALETISGGQQRTAATAHGLAPATVAGPLTAPVRLAWGLGETGSAPVDDLFGATQANCVKQFAVSWLALASQSTGLRISVPADVSTGDYLSLASTFIAAEGETASEAALIQVHDLLDTGNDAPTCEAPASNGE